MNWRDSMGPASFRGVQFFVDTSERTGGRRNVLHEYPFRDNPFSEDLGRGARGFQVEGYVFGDEYFTDRDALITALEKEGPGELVHPYYGTRQVALAGPFRVRESAREGGIAQFAIEFVETLGTDNDVIASQVDAAGSVRASALAARAASQTQFTTGFTVGPFMDSVTTAVQNVAASIDGLLGGLTLATQVQATLTARLGALSDNAAELVQNPDDLYLSLVGVFELIDDITFLTRAYGFDPGTRPPATTANRALEQACFDALTLVTQRLVVVRAAELLPDQEFDSYDTAVAQRNAVAELLDDQAETASDDTYPALLQLRADIIKAVPGLDSDLPRLVVYTPPVTVPSLVLTHRLYGALDLEQDVVSRNHIRHPGFVAGGRSLEVLSSE